MSGRTPGPEGEPRPTLDGTGPKAGQQVGPYRLVRLIGQGATGRVFEVQHLGIGRRAAMKILAPEHAGRPGANKSLLAEAQAVSTISHPHIVAVTDLIEAEGPDGANAIVMELLEGESLGHAILEKGRMAPARFLPILAQVADALAAAHGARLVHRDLKPENVFLTIQTGERDFVKLLDFGLAKTITQTVVPQRYPQPDHARTPGEEVFVGTPAYAAPEQAAGRSVDHRADIYSLGVILYELLCGRLPFEGRNFGEYVVKHLTADPPPAPDEVLRTPLGRTLDAVARRCLAKDRRARFSSAADLRTIFQRLAAGETEIPGLPAPSPPPARRRRWLTAAVLVLVMGGAGVLWWQARAHRAPVALATARPPGPRIVPLPAGEPPLVSLSFVSQPPGAEVRRADTGELLGVTPFARAERATGAEVVYEVKLAGYAPRRERVLLIAGAARHRRVGGKLHHTGRRRRSRNATLNPFAH